MYDSAKFWILTLPPITLPIFFVGVWQIGESLMKKCSYEKLIKKLTRIEKYFNFWPINKIAQVYYVILHYIFIFLLYIYTVMYSWSGHNLHFILSSILLLSPNPTSFWATHEYIPASARRTFWMTKLKFAIRTPWCLEGFMISFYGEINMIIIIHIHS